MALFRKLLGNNQEGVPGKGSLGRGAPPPGHQSMGAQLQRKFAKGIQYNIKIVIKGDRNVGKSCLFYRLQGQKFVEEYLPTDEIQVASIHWNYKTMDDVVKVEVWDVVDKGRKKKKKLDGLKIGNSQTDDSELCLDAEFVDVYKGTQGVILIYDITKQWTFTYIEREMEKVPAHIPILVLGNHRDMGHHRTVTEDKARYYVRHLERPEGAAQVRYAEASMRNSFGLKYIHKFFNLPFLQLQRETLLKQLELNAEDMTSTIEELDIHEESEEQNYDVFIEAVCTKRRQQQEEKSDIQSGKEEPQIQTKPTNLPINVPRSVSAPAIQKSTMATEPVTPDPVPSPVSQTPQATTPSTDTQTNNQVKDNNNKMEQKQGLFSRIFRNKPNKQKPAVTSEVTMENGVVSTTPVQSVEDFIPDGGELDSSFLEDTKDGQDSKSASAPKNQNSDSDDDDDVGNPMVAGFQDDLDSDDEPDIPVTKATKVKQDIVLSSEEEEEEEIAVIDDEKKKVPSPNPLVKSVDSGDSNENSPIESKDEGDYNDNENESTVKNSVLYTESDIPTSTRPVASGSLSSGSEQENVAVRSSGAEEGDKSANQMSDSESGDQDQEVKVLQDVDINTDDLGGSDVFSSWLDTQETKKYTQGSKSKPSRKDKISLSQSEEEEEDVIEVKPKKSHRSSYNDVDGNQKDGLKKKKKKKKEKEKEGEHSEKKHKKKEKKADQREGKEKTREKEKDSSKKEKKKKKKIVTEEEMDDLEKFLADDDDNTMSKPGAEAGYESL